MADLVLATLNAKYHHSSFGLRYLMANLGELAERAVMLEFGINQLALDMLDQILEQRPRIVGFGVYIWNVEQTTRLLADLKRVRPDILVVLGGPEVSYETEGQPIVELADYVISGEADLAFPQLCARLLNGERPDEKILAAPVPKLDELRLPYDLYTDEDIANRVIYVEASRGCPFTCEFCLSALEIPVRQFPLETFLAAMQSLLDRGARQFKFVDRTFNLNMRVSGAILQFFLERYVPGLFLHFEMIPDRLPEGLRNWIKQFPPGALQFEVGIQTFNETVSDLISRRQNNELVAQNLKFLREETGVHIHTDLIVGLPGETVESFQAGFDQLVRMQPQEIQVGMLKRLKGTPIIRHDQEWEMIYSPHPPFEILQTRDLDVETLSRFRRFARFWDLIANSGNFPETLPQVWKNESPFLGFSELSEWLYLQLGKTYGISLIRLSEMLFRFLTEVRSLPTLLVAESLWQDYQKGGRSDKPRFLRNFPLSAPESASSRAAAPRRQSRHLSHQSESAEP